MDQPQPTELQESRDIQSNTMIHKNDEPLVMYVTGSRSELTQYLVKSREALKKLTEDDHQLEHFHEIETLIDIVQILTEHYKKRKFILELLDELHDSIQLYCKIVGKIPKEPGEREKSRLDQILQDLNEILLDLEEACEIVDMESKLTQTQTPEKLEELLREKTTDNEESQKDINGSDRDKTSENEVDILFYCQYLQELTEKSKDSALKGISNTTLNWRLENLATLIAQLIRDTIPKTVKTEQEREDCFSMIDDFDAIVKSFLSLTRDYPTDLALESVLENIEEAEMDLLQKLHEIIFFIKSYPNNETLSFPSPPKTPVVHLQPIKKVDLVRRGSIIPNYSPKTRNDIPFSPKHMNFPPKTINSPRSLKNFVVLSPSYSLNMEFSPKRQINDGLKDSYGCYSMSNPSKLGKKESRNEQQVRPLGGGSIRPTHGWIQSAAFSPSLHSFDPSDISGDLPLSHHHDQL